MLYVRLRFGRGSVEVASSSLNLPFLKGGLREDEAISKPNI
ncbi:hypothetical protein SAMN04488121_1161 [Chitinophaga filiformis]|uniref:Uncharacterized protein n=1 Tax=Chitinophaga filiformis TaxID=104663 RepID=A0A1G8DV95_CHIFI|nr:hypothetical protein SAMN04488121_1161 [Chitinophaga filiformis]